MFGNDVIEINKPGTRVAVKGSLIVKNKLANTIIIKNPHASGLGLASKPAIGNKAPSSPATESGRSRVKETHIEYDKLEIFGRLYRITTPESQEKISVRKKM